MKIPNATQIHDLDAYTIQNEPISSINLMERASDVFVQWFLGKQPKLDIPIYVFCGPGNNGGDGLAIARFLHLINQWRLTIFDCHFGKTTPDRDLNLKRLGAIPGIRIIRLEDPDHYPPIPREAIIIDALLGSGLNRIVEGYWAELIRHLNTSGAQIFSVDVPSGMFADRHTSGASIEASQTLSFELPKLAFFLPENQKRVGDWEVGKIGLMLSYLDSLHTDNYAIDPEMIHKIYRKRNKFSHKGNFGHALLMVGAYGKIGAAVLSAKACLRSGVGLLSIHSPACAYDILQMSVPEAMVSTDVEEKYISGFPPLETHQAIGMGCGVGQLEPTARMLRMLLTQYTMPLVLDADALNIMAGEPDMLNLIPKGSILTPHPKEFERLFGPSANDFERIEKLKSRSELYGVYILLKGANTCIATPEGHCYFNTTGNPGMATGGSGDVLTGILTGLLAQGYHPLEAALLGVYLHGLAGDIAAEHLGQEAMIAGDIIRYLGEAFLRIENLKNKDKF